MEFTYQYDYIFTVIQKIVMFENFCAIDFCVEIFSWPGATTKIYYHKICSHMLRKWRIKKGLSCVRGFHVYRDI